MKPTRGKSSPWPEISTDDCCRHRGGCNGDTGTRIGERIRSRREPEDSTLATRPELITADQASRASAPQSCGDSAQVGDRPGCMRARTVTGGPILWPMWWL